VSSLTRTRSSFLLVALVACLRSFGGAGCGSSLGSAGTGGASGASGAGGSVGGDGGFGGAGYGGNTAGVGGLGGSGNGSNGGSIAVATGEGGGGNLPPAYRPQAVVCQISPAAAATTGTVCEQTSECPIDGGRSLYCVQQVCTVDRCLVDDDCGPGFVCVCANQFPHSLTANACIASSCRIDADCGQDGRCALSRGGDPALCPTIDGYHCRSAADTCVGTAVHDLELLFTACLRAQTIGLDRSVSG
jgi:hypothetical protein